MYISHLSHCSYPRSPLEYVVASDGELVISITQLFIWLLFLWLYQKVWQPCKIMTCISRYQVKTTSDMIQKGLRKGVFDAKKRIKKEERLLVIIQTVYFYQNFESSTYFTILVLNFIIISYSLFSELLFCLIEHILLVEATARAVQ